MSWEHIRIALLCFWSALAFLPAYGSVQVPTSLAIFAKIMGMFLSKDMLKVVLFVCCHYQICCSEATFTGLSLTMSMLYTIKRIIESFRLQKILKIVESTLNPALPSPALNRVLKCRIYLCLKYLQPW